MSKFRLAGPALADLKEILSVSAERWGDRARDRYAALLTAAMQQAANDPAGRFVRDQKGLKSGLLSFHVRHARTGSSREVKRPAHVIYFRVVEAGTGLIVRVLHERMDPTRHLPSSADE